MSKQLCVYDAWISMHALAIFRLAWALKNSRLRDCLQRCHNIIYIPLPTVNFACCFLIKITLVVWLMGRLKLIYRERKTLLYS
jgi:hypothetical protein